MKKWISVNDRMPGEYATVLVQLRAKVYDIAVYCAEYGFRPWYSEFFEDCTPEWDAPDAVVAWMELPKPYREVEA